MLFDGSERTRDLQGSQLRVVADVEPEGLRLPPAEQLDGLRAAAVGCPKIGGTTRPKGVAGVASRRVACLVEKGAHQSHRLGSGGGCRPRDRTSISVDQRPQGECWWTLLESHEVDVVAQPTYSGGWPIIREGDPLRGARLVGLREVDGESHLLAVGGPCEVAGEEALQLEPTEEGIMGDAAHGDALEVTEVAQVGLSLHGTQHLVRDGQLAERG